MSVYLIGEVGQRSRSVRHVKIGTAVDPKRRLSELQTGNPRKLEILATAPGGIDVEKSLHDAYSEWRVHREWFAIPIQQLDSVVAGFRAIKPRPKSQWRAPTADELEASFHEMVRLNAAPPREWTLKAPA